MSQGKPADEPTEIASRYEIVQKLGAGAFGTVYKAKDKILGRMLAIKTIRLEGLAAQGASLQELTERFTREAQVSAQLKHPNIVTVYDVGNADGISYLAMEFLDGVGLDKIIRDAGKVDVERACSLGAQVADALDFAHKHNIVHRDIKPANIMVEAGDRAKVTDFGIAKVRDSGDHLTMTGSLLGTPSYMSPEQARGADIDGRSDLFAVGCIMYEMVSGKKAFRGDSITGLIFKIITEEPPNLQETDPELPDEMVRIISKALNKAPDQRYQTGREMADDLLKLTRPGMVPTVRQSDVDTAVGVAATINSASPTSIGANATRVGVGAKTQVAPASRATPPPLPRPPAPPSARAAQAPQKKSNMGMIIAVVAVLGLLGVGGVGFGAWYLFMRKPVVAASDAPPSIAPPMTTQPIDTPPSTAPEPPPPPPSTTLVASNGTEPEVTRPYNPGSDTTPPSSLQSGVRPPATQAPAERPPVTRPPATQPPPPANSDFAALDDEPEMDGRESGEHVADTYRRPGGSNGGTGFGASGKLRARERSPRNLGPAERPAVATVRYLMDKEEGHHRRTQRYASLAEMLKSGHLPLDVQASGSGFQRKGYRFEVTVDDDGYKVLATPVAVGGRPFIGDDSGYIRAGVE